MLLLLHWQSRNAMKSCIHPQMLVRIFILKNELNIELRSGWALEGLNDHKVSRDPNFQKNFKGAYAQIFRSKGDLVEIQEA